MTRVTIPPELSMQMSLMSWDRELGVSSGSESPSAAAVAEAVEPQADCLVEMLAEFPSPTDEAAISAVAAIEAVGASE